MGVELGVERGDVSERRHASELGGLVTIAMSHRHQPRAQAGDALLAVTSRVCLPDGWLCYATAYLRLPCPPNDFSLIIILFDNIFPHTSTINMTFKPALVVVDVQEDFCPPVSVACLNFSFLLTLARMDRLPYKTDETLSPLSTTSSPFPFPLKSQPKTFTRKTTYPSLQITHRRTTSPSSPQS